MARRGGLRLRRLLRGRGRLPGWAWWTGFALLFGAGAAFRIYWTVVLGAPFLQPDSVSYLTAALAAPALPMSEMRTAGEPWVVSLGLALFRGPRGILVVNNLLWAASTLAAVWVVRARLGLAVGSLALLAYLCFAHGNMVAEYTLLSEHPARCLTLLTFAVLVLALGAPARRRYGLALGVLVLAGVLVKPPAVTLLVAVALFYGLAAWLLPAPRRALAVNAGLVAAVVVVGLLAYCQAFKQRYGTFSLTHFTGLNLYAHVGHLTDLDGPAYPEIKAELRTFLPFYVHRYAARRDYQPSWLTYGATIPAMRRDFGDRNPREVVDRYVAAHPGGTYWQRLDRVFLDLAVEGIRAHPGDYAALVARDTVRFLSFLPVTAGDMTLSPRSIRAHLEGLQTLSGLVDPDRPANRGRTASGIGRRLWEALGHGLYLPPYTRPGEPHRYVAVWHLLVPPAWAIDRLGHRAPPVQAALLLLLFPVTWKGLRRDRLVALASAYLILFGTGLFYALVNTADPVRYLIPVRDLWVIALILTVALAGAAARRMALLGARARRGGRP